MKKVSQEFMREDEFAQMIEQSVHRQLAKFDVPIQDVRSLREYQLQDIDCIITKPDGKHTVEIKGDRNTVTSDNIFLETQSGRNLGWFNVSTAEYVYYVEYIKGARQWGVYIFKLQDLRDLVKAELDRDWDIFEQRTFTKYENGRPKLISGVLFPVELLPAIPSFTFLIIDNGEDTQ